MSTLTQTRMNNRITLHVHKEKTDALDLKAIANEFTANVHVWKVLISVMQFLN